jgi:hypothetical protein
VTDPARRIVLLVRDGCHLCDQFLLDLSLTVDTGTTVVEVVDVDSDPELAARFGLRVPVLTVGGEVVSEGWVDAERVRHALAL